MTDSKDSADAGAPDVDLVKSTASTKPGKASKGRFGNPFRWVAGLFRRLARFVREVVAELRKVIYPTRSELITYTLVVIVFVSIMTAVVAGLDAGFTKVVLFVFGTPGDE